ncbi:MAG: NADH-quinone oxidoreductase subunit C [Gemmatimonadota bacterium]
MADRSFDEALGDLDTGAAPAADSGAPRGAEADASAHPSVAALRTRFGDAILHHTVAGRDEHVVYVAAGRNREILKWLHDDAAQRYDLLLDVTAVDYAGGRPLEVIYQLWSIPYRRALRVKVTLPVAALEVDSVTPVWRSADWLERETYDMFGVTFNGHPDLRRILMPENYAEGHPLRKDFPLRGRFTRAEQTRRALSMATEDFYTPQELSVAQGSPAPGAETREEPGTAPGGRAGVAGVRQGGATGPEGAA